MLVGALLLVFGTLLFCKTYSRYLFEGIYLSEGFLEYLVFLRREIANYSKTPSEARRSFKNSSLEKSGFLLLLDGGKSHAEAFEEIADRTSIPLGVAEGLREYFAGSGKRFVESEVAALDRCIGTLRDLLPPLKEKAQKDSKSTYAVAMAICLGFIILVI